MVEKKICLVTGANSGIGKEICLALARSGAHVIMVCRNAEKGKAALQEIEALSGSKSLDLMIADLSTAADICTLVKNIKARYSLLHVLINNAGLILTQRTLTSEGHEMTLALNHLAPFLLTQLLMDLLKKASPSRIINVSSGAHKWARVDLEDLHYTRRKYRFFAVYAQSKLLLNSATIELARRLEGTGITANCVHPGAVNTNLGTANATTPFLKLMDKAIKFFLISPADAAKGIVDLALSDAFTTTSGKYFIKGKLSTASRLSYDPLFAQQIWKLTENLINV